MVNQKLELLSYNEGDYNEDSVLEVIDLEQNTGIYTTHLDMTSLATLVFMDTGHRSISLESGSTIHDENDEYRLTLAYERINIIPKTLVDRFCPTIQILDISHNKIKNLDFLIQFKKLTSLIADDNPINEETAFPPMPKLELLWLNHCRVGKLFPWIRKLKQSCPGLKHMCIMGNPAAPSYLNGGTFYEYLQYRLFVISLFPSLVHLDDRAVTEDQRIEARRLYKRPLLERLALPLSSPLISLASPNEMSLTNSTLKKWRALHEKMSGLFDPQTPATNGRNLLV